MIIGGTMPKGIGEPYNGNFMTVRLGWVIRIVILVIDRKIAVPQVRDPLRQMSRTLPLLKLCWNICKISDLKMLVLTAFFYKDHLVSGVSISLNPDSSRLRTYFWHSNRCQNPLSFRSSKTGISSYLHIASRVSTIHHILVPRARATALVIRQ